MVAQLDDRNASSQAERTPSRGRGNARGAAAVRTLQAAWLLGTVAALLVLLVGADAAASFGRVHPGVSVGGVNVGGKTPTEAVALLKTQLQTKAETPVTVTAGTHTWSVTGSEIGASFDYGKLLQSAMAVGRGGGPIESARERATAWFGHASIPATAQADPKKLDGVLDKVASAVDVRVQDAAVAVSGDQVSMRPSVMGVTVDRGLLTRELVSAIMADRRAVSVRTTTTAPRIDDAAARTAQSTVRQMIAEPVTLVADAKTLTLSRQQLAEMISITAVDASGSAGRSLVAKVSPAAVSKTIVPQLGGALSSAAQSAAFIPHGNTVSITPSKDGQEPDTAQLASDLDAELKSGAAGPSVVVHAKVVSAGISTARAQSMGVRELISSFTTAYSGGAAGRAQNIQVLGKALDGKLVAPGDTFSVNGAIGERTAAKGYTEANAIVHGKLVPQVGGGICQVCTTLFNAVFLSGLPITERQPHGFYISHYPTGRDATVSWDGPDLKWKNTTNSWVLVSVSLANSSPAAGSVTVSLYGTNPKYSVSYATGQFTNVRPFTTLYVKDPTQTAGAQTVIDPGVEGKRIVVTRTVMRNGKTVRTDEFVSNYAPKAETVYVGTKAAAAAPKLASTAVAKKR